MNADLSRRGLLGVILCAPAIVRASSLMAIKVVRPDLMDWGSLAPPPFDLNGYWYSIVGVDQYGKPMEEHGVARPGAPLKPHTLFREVTTITATEIKR